jgi:hypothetical protein
MRGMKRTFLALTAVALLVAGCGDGDDPGGEPTGAAESSAGPPTTGSEPDGSQTTVTASPTASATSEAKDICDVITDEAATTWAGTPQRVSEAQDGGWRTMCNTIVDSDDGLGLEWYLQKADKPYAEAVELEAEPSLERTDLRLAGGVRAARFESEDYVGSPYVKVVTVVDKQLLIVEALETPIGDKPITLAKLRTIATKVANAYAAR